MIMSTVETNMMCLIYNNRSISMSRLILSHFQLPIPIRDFYASNCPAFERRAMLGRHVSEGATRIVKDPTGMAKT